MYKQAPPREECGIVWYIFELPGGQLDVDELDSDASRAGKVIAGPFSGPLGFSQAMATIEYNTAKEAQNDS
jgi:hypothetical protein